jgi:O-antigen/teichoic acid export membrane protein
MRQQVKKLMLGNGLAQALQFGSILLLSRIYAPSDFGYLAQVQSIAMLGAIWITLQLHLTIPLQKTIEDAKRAIIVIEKISMTIFLIAIIPAALFGDVFGYAIALSLFLGLANTYNGYLVYSGKFGTLSVFYIVRALLIIAMQISFSILDFKDGLIWGTLTGEIFSAIYLRKMRVGSLKGIGATYKHLLEYTKSNKAFSLYGSIQETISVGAFFVPLFLFTYKFGEAVGGQYAMANRLVWAPVILFVSSYAQVLFHIYGKNQSEKSVEIKFGRLEYSVLCASIFLAIFLFIFDEVPVFVIGKAWELASLLIPINIIWGVIFFLSTPYRVMIRVRRRQKIQLQADVLSICLMVTIFIFVDLDPVALMIFLVIIGAAQNIYLAKMVCRGGEGD